MTSITNRRRFMTAACAICAATISTALAIAADPVVCLAPDPILAAIDDHLGIIRVVDAKPSDPQLVAMEGYAAMVVVNTVPTSTAGHRALEAHLSRDRSVECLRIIRNRWLETQPGREMSAEDVEYVAAADGMEWVRRYYQRPREAFLAERAA